MDLFGRECVPSFEIWNKGRVREELGRSGIWYHMHAESFEVRD